MKVRKTDQKIDSDVILFIFQAAEESMLRKTPTTNLMYFGELRSGRLDPQMGHLTCFVGGLYVLSSSTGALQLNSTDKHEMEIAQGIGKTCRESYIRTRRRFLSRQDRSFHRLFSEWTRTRRISF